MTLTKDNVKELCAELPLESGHSVRVTSESKPEADKQWAVWLVYTEEGPITTRLDKVDPNWEFEITNNWADGQSATVYARLTVGGVARDCVGSGKNTKPEEAQKGAATDALKRGARLFGIGRYLLDAPQFYTDWAPKKRGNEWVRTRTQEKQWEKEAFSKFATWYRNEFGNSNRPVVGHCEGCGGTVVKDSQNNVYCASCDQSPSTAPRQQSAPDPSELDKHFGPKQPRNNETKPGDVVLVTANTWGSINHRLVDAGLANASNHAWNRLAKIVDKELGDGNVIELVTASGWTEADLEAKFKARIAEKANES